MENKTISILIATYNGEKYLKEQLLSLINQTYPHWQLWIKDDGSTDSTVSIIDDFCLLDSRIQKVSSFENNLGAGKAFFSLLLYANSHYTIFCDQDDIWLENKLLELLQFAEEKLAVTSPGMVYCDAYAYSSTTGTIISQSVSHLHANNLKEFLFFNSGYQGCSILFNQRLTEIAKQYTPEFFMHDDIISLIGHTFGDVYFLDKPLMYYRQHDNNVTGSTARNKWDMLRGFFRKNAKVLSKPHYDEKVNFYHFYYNNIDPMNRSFFEAYINFPKTSLIKRLYTIWHYNFSLGGHKSALYLKTLLRSPL